MIEEGRRLLCIEFEAVAKSGVNWDETGGNVYGAVRPLVAGDDL